MSHPFVIGLTVRVQIGELEFRFENWTRIDGKEGFVRASFSFMNLRPRSHKQNYRPEKHLFNDPPRPERPGAHKTAVEEHSPGGKGLEAPGNRGRLMARHGDSLEGSRAMWTGGPAVVGNAGALPVDRKLCDPAF